MGKGGRQVVVFKNIVRFNSSLFFFLDFFFANYRPLSLVGRKGIGRELFDTIKIFGTTSFINGSFACVKSICI